MAMNKRKTTTAIVAGVTALALLLGGTFAWTSISQQARNEAIVDINPGGRLHDDFNGTDKDVYVENFSSGATGVNIFARIRLDQYFEVGQDAGINKGEADRKVNQILGTDINDVESWITYLPGDDLGDTSQVQANANWQWNLGNEDDNRPYYMPTFNKNKDSLKADINGTYEGTTEGDIVHYDDYLVYVDAEGNPKTVTADAIYDWDEDTDEDYESETRNENDPIDAADVLKKEETHTAAQVTYAAQVISMADWLALPAEQQIGNFWVYDTDGWAYWANPIAPGETTGLLLDGINMSRVPDDNYYYGINVVGQFATASDWTMLFEPTANGGGGSMTDNAKTLMELITATTSTEDGGEDDDNTDDITNDGTLTLDSVSSDVEEVTVNTELPVEFDASDIAADATQPDISDITVTYEVYNEGTGEYDTTTLEKDTQYTYTYDEETQTGSLVIIDPDLLYERLEVADKNDVVSGYVDVEEETQTAIITIDWYQPNAEGYIYLNAVTTQENEYTVYVDDSFDLKTLTATEATGVTFTPDIANKTATLTISPFAWNPTTITATDVNGATETVTVVPLFDTIQVTPDMNGTTLTLGPGPYGLVPEGFAEGTDVVFSIEAIDNDNPITRCEILNNSGAYSLSVATAETAPSLYLVATQGETVVKVTLNLVNTSPSLEPDFGYVDQGELTGMGMEETTYVVSFKPGHNYLLSTSVPHTFEGTVAWSIDETAPAYFGDGTDTTKKQSDPIDPRDGLVQLHIAEDATVGSTFVMTAQLTDEMDGMPALYYVNVTIVDPNATIE